MDRRNFLRTGSLAMLGSLAVPSLAMPASVRGALGGADNQSAVASAMVHFGVTEADLKKVMDLGLDKLPVCIAKTQKSLSDNPKLLGRPKDFVVTVRQIEIASGAGFIIPITGSIMRMPGLPDIPAAEKIDIDNNGKITGLF